jgi:hypothetical protein
LQLASAKDNEVTQFPPRTRSPDRKKIANFRRSQKLSKGDEADAAQICRSLAEAVLMMLDQMDNEPAESGWRMQRLERAMLVARLGRGFLAAGFDDLLGQLVSHGFARPDLYSLRKVHIPALAKLGP